MVNVYKPTPDDVAIIKSAAARESVPRVSVGAVLLEPGIRVGPKGCGINMMLVTDDAKWSDAQLENYGTWATFKRGVELTPEGNADVDFYIRGRGDVDRELLGNVTIEVRNGKLTRVYGYGNDKDYFNA